MHAYEWLRAGERERERERERGYTIGTSSDKRVIRYTEYANTRTRAGELIVLIKCRRLC
jgi:hypothetical protein